MIDAIIAYSVRNKLIIGLFIVGLIGWGSYSLMQLPIDAVPDITNNQVQVITNSPNLSALEVERFITSPIERVLQNIPGVIELRSISRFGLSMVTVVFEDSKGTYLPRQLVSQQLKLAEKEIPPEFGIPEMTPISTGLGEIYQYVLHVKEGYEGKYSAMELRTMQDWIVRRQLSGIKGVVEVNSFGGFLKQYEVAVNPEQLRAMNITVPEIVEALNRSNENIGSAYIEKDPNAYFIRSEGLVQNLADIENIVVKNVNGIPVLVRNVAKVQFGHAPRFGALTRNGEGEVVGGIVMMLKGENAAQVMERVKERVLTVQSSLPEGVVIEPFLERSKLVNRAIATVKTNLLEGGLIVIFVLVLLLGNFRAGLIVASVIPLAMLFALGMMNVFGVSANLMSLGAIDFGLVVDGAVIIVESILHGLQVGYAGQRLSAATMDQNVITSATKIRKSAAFGEIIILIVYLPILTLTGVEGKMFGPMAQTVSFAILGALLLSITYVPMMSALFLGKHIQTKKTFADRIMGFFKRAYRPIIHFALRFKGLVIGLVILLFGVSIWRFSTLGGEFLPTLEEGDLALHQILPPGSSLAKSVEVSGKLQNLLMDEFPEVEQIVSKIGTAEIPTDLMSIETGDIIVTLKDKSEWTSAETLGELFEKMEAKMNEMPGIGYEFQQPIQMRFNELMTGSRADIAVKIYGDDLDKLFEKGKEAERLINQKVEGVGSTTVEQLTGMPQVVIRYDYAKLAEYGLHIKDVNTIIQAAYAGAMAGTVFEGERRFDLVVRLDQSHREDLEGIENLYIPLDNGRSIPLQMVAKVSIEEAPMQISKDNAQRRITVGVNTNSKDVETLVEDIQKVLVTDLQLPSGYYVTYGGQFENLKAATDRLLIVVPLALALIFILLYLTFHSLSQAILIFTAIPLASIGGIWALVLRDMPFSISAGVGFIALFGVAVLNGIVLIGYFNELEKEGITDVRERILKGTMVRLRPVIMTASVASLGFLPMALSHSAGAEVQRPLATVVIGGLITATLLTLVVLPILYSWFNRFQVSKPLLVVGLLLIVGTTVNGQSFNLQQTIEAVEAYHPTLKTATLQIEQQQALQNKGYEWNKTDVFYRANALGIPNANRQHDFGVGQSFRHPKLFKAQDALQDELVNLAKIEKDQFSLQLHQQITFTYYDFVAAKHQLRNLQALVQTYQDALKIAQLRVEVGEANQMEVTVIEQQINTVTTQQLLTINRIKQHQVQLQGWTGISNLTIADSTLKILSIENLPPTTSTSQHIDLAYWKQQQAVAQAQTNVVQNQLSPDLKVAYFYQIFDGQGGFHGVEIGIGIPLQKQPQQKRIAATQIGKDIAQSQQTATQTQLDNRLNQLFALTAQYKTLIKHYDDLARKGQADWLPTATISYQGGAATYLEYLKLVEQVGNYTQEHLKAVQLHNQAVVELNFLLKRY